MAELSYILANNVRLGQAAIHDLQSAASVSIAVADGYVDYVNLGDALDNGNMVIWDTVNSVADTSSMPLWSNLDIKLTSTVNFSNATAILEIQFYIPHPSGDIVISTIDKTPKRSNTAYDECIVCLGYNGQDMIDYGIKIRTSVTVGTVTITSRSILIRA